MFFSYNNNTDFVGIYCYQLGSYTMIGYRVNEKSLSSDMFSTYIIAVQIGEYIESWQYRNSKISTYACTFDILYYI